MTVNGLYKTQRELRSHSQLFDSIFLFIGKSEVLIYIIINVWNYSAKLKELVQVLVIAIG